MPILEFALDATGTNRVQTFWEAGKGNLTILINGGKIGSISQEELVGGRTFALADGSILKVQVVNNQVQVLRNGWPLLSLQAKPSPSLPSSLLIRIGIAAGAVLLIGVISILLGLLYMLGSVLVQSQTASSTLQLLSIFHLFLGGIFLLLGILVIFRLRLALSIAVTLAVATMLLTLFGATLLDFAAALVDILLLFPMIQGFSAIRRADEARAAQLEG
jgi:hypothetical protein